MNEPRQMPIIVVSHFSCLRFYREKYTRGRSSISKREILYCDNRGGFCEIMAVLMTVAA